MKVIFVILFLFPALALAVSEGPNSPDSAWGAGVWVDSLNALASDDAYAVYNGTGKDKLCLNDFDFSAIPDAAETDSIVVGVEGYVQTDPDISVDVFDTRCGESAGPVVIQLPEGEDYVYASFLIAYTGLEIKNTDFSVMIWDDNTDANDINIDHVRMTVYYTVPPASNAWIDSLYNDYQLVMGPRSPGHADSIFGGANWGLKSNAATSNNAYARIGIDKTDSLIVRYFNMGLPAADVVHGVQVEIECKSVLVVGGSLTMDVALTEDGTTPIGTWQSKVVSQTESYHSIGDDTTTWGTGALGQGQNLNPSTWGILIKAQSGNSADSLLIDHLRVTAWYGSEYDSIVVGAETGAETWPDSIIFVVDTTQTAWPDTDTYSWRSALPYTANTEFMDTLLIYNIEANTEDTVRLSVYIKDNVAGYSVPDHFQRRFEIGGVEPVYQVVTGWARADSARTFGSPAWARPESARFDDNIRATYDFSTVGYATRLILWDFDFAIPDNAIIVGVEVADSTYGGSSVLNRRAMTGCLTLNRNDTTGSGALAQDFNAPFGTTEGEVLLGGVNRTMKISGTWTSAQVNNFGFGIMFWDRNALTGALHIDGVVMRIYYDLPITIPCFIQSKSGGGYIQSKSGGSYIQRK